MAFRRVRIRNFKQFEDLSVSCKKSNVFVGPNNAGKSTILDSLRVVHDVARQIRRKNPILRSVEGGAVCASYDLDHSILSLPIENVVRDYGDEDAKLEVTHSNGNTLTVQLHPNRPITAFLSGPAAPPRTAGAVAQAFPQDIIVVPTLGPFEREERYRQDETVRANETTRLMHRNFRNIWLRRSGEEFEALRELVSETWEDIEIERPEYRAGLDSHVQMYFRERRMTREVYWSGFGFQVWLQMLTHILRASAGSCIVLDEPDIYLHPDLQRSLVGLTSERFSQTFIATHSTEIINETNPGDVIEITRTRRHAKRIQSDEDYRSLFNYIGSSENAEFSRLARARRAVFFEGKDRRMLRRFAAKVPGIHVLDNVDTAYFQSGGFGQWRRIVDADWTLENMFGMQIKIGCIFDRDFRSWEECCAHVSRVQGGRDNIRCFVLERKEIENYALVVDSVTRAIAKRLAIRDFSIPDAEVLDILDSIAEEFKYDVKSQITGHLQEPGWPRSARG